MKPNIVLIMTDQQRADLARREGYPLDTMPFVDGLAAEGTWFSRAYTPAPVCMVARAAMLTGRYPSANRVRTNYNAEDLYAATDMMRHFREAGYATGLSGKNHSHLTPGDVDLWFHAGHVGADDARDDARLKEFDRFIGTMHMHLHTEPTPFPVEYQLPHRIVDQARSWIETLERDRPFLLWMSFPEPHNPYQVPEPYYSLFPPEALPPVQYGPEALPTKGFGYEWCRRSFEGAFPDYAATIDRARANYHGMIRMVDDQVRRFVEFLAESGRLEDTLLVFVSDHGDFAGEYGLMRKGPDLNELLARVPMIFRGPGVVPRPEPQTAHVSLVDIFPTLCEASGTEIPAGVQGRSLWPLLTGEPYPEAEFASAYAEHGFGGLPYCGGEPLDPALDGFEPSPPDGAWGGYDCLNSRTQSGTARMLRRDDWKLAFDALGRGELYHLPTDPREMRNRFGDSDVAAVQAELTADLLTWVLRVQDPLPLPRANRQGRRYVPKTAPHNFWTPHVPKTQQKN